MARTPQETSHAALVSTFLDELINQRDLSAIDRYIHPSYRQIYSDTATPPEATKAFFADAFARFPRIDNRILDLVVEGTTVIAIVENSFYGPGGELVRRSRVADLFRVRDGKLVEHGDVVQQLEP